LNRDLAGSQTRPEADGRQWLLVGGLLRQNGLQTPHWNSMHTVLQDRTRALLSVSIDELNAIKRAVEAAGFDAALADAHYSVEFGVSRQVMQALHAALCKPVHESRSATELVEAWEEQGAVMVRAMNTFGDPVELGEVSAAEYLEQLQRAVRHAS